KYLADYVNELGSYAKSLDNKMQTYYLTADEINIIGTTYKQSCEEPDPNTIDSNAIDGIILAVNGFTWLFDESNTDFNNIYNKYISSNHPIYITASLSKEWEYPPEFYRGIARYYAGLNSSGIIITANNSGEGELGPAFVKQHYGKLNEIKFTVPPPAQDNITSTEDGKNDTHHIPENISLYQNYPNPFNPITTINYSIPATLYVTLKVYDLLGREVAKLVHEEKPRGVYKVNFDGSKLSSGIYFYRLQAGSFSETKKILLIK
ncbi:MAG: T9SS type A sorting domain-containing protein, partial [Ignavibacteriaceae bacterium]